MIKANDLRIGNLVFIDNDGKHVHQRIEGIVLATKESQIDQYSSPFIIYENGSSVLQVDEDTDEYDIVKPIPLTQKILEKCGFETGTDGYYWQYKKAMILVERGEVFYLADCDIDFALNYLHDLQNIFYLAYKEELEINL